MCCVGLLDFSMHTNMVVTILHFDPVLLFHSGIKVFDALAGAEWGSIRVATICLSTNEQTVLSCNMNKINTYTMCVETFLIAQNSTMIATVVSKHKSEPQFGGKGYVCPVYF